MSSKFGFILVKPQLGENIGACARAMKNFGFSKLHIVEPKINFPNHKAKATSVGAYDIINKAKVFNNIQDAIEPFNLVVSLSARRRDINKKKIKNKGVDLKVSSKSKISSLLAHLTSLLENKNFFIPREKRRSMILNINNLIYRLEPNDKELRILASIISTLSKK